MSGRKHANRKRKNKRRARRNNVQNNPQPETCEYAHIPGHNCQVYAQFMSPNATKESAGILKTEILELKHHLVSLHVLLAEITIENYHFKKDAREFSDKIDILNIIGCDSTDEEKEECKSNKASSSTSTCYCPKHRCEEDSEEDYDSEETVLLY